MKTFAQQIEGLLWNWWAQLEMDGEQTAQDFNSMNVVVEVQVDLDVVQGKAAPPGIGGGGSRPPSGYGQQSLAAFQSLTQSASNPYGVQNKPQKALKASYSELSEKAKAQVLAIAKQKALMQIQRYLQKRSE